MGADRVIRIRGIVTIRHDFLRAIRPSFPEKRGRRSTYKTVPVDLG